MNAARNRKNEAFVRTVNLLVLVLALSTIGCSVLVVNSGTNLEKLTTRAQVHDSFGQPINSGQIDDEPFEEFITHRKIAEQNMNIYLVMGYAGTFGLGELIWFPQQSYLAIRRSVVGQRLRFTYDEAGMVTHICRDDDYICTPPKPYRGPAPRVTVVVPEEYHGPLKIHLLPTAGRIQEEPDKREFCFHATETGDVFIEATPLVRESVNWMDIECRYANGARIESADGYPRPDDPSPALYHLAYLYGRSQLRLKGSLFVIGSRAEYEAVHATVYHYLNGTPRHITLNDEAIEALFAENGPKR